LSGIVYAGQGHLSLEPGTLRADIVQKLLQDAEPRTIKALAIALGETELVVAHAIQTLQVWFKQVFDSTVIESKGAGKYWIRPDAR